MIKSGRALRLGRLFKGDETPLFSSPWTIPSPTDRSPMRVDTMRCWASSPTTEPTPSSCTKVVCGCSRAPSMPACRGRPSQRIDQIRRRSDLQVPGCGGRGLFAQRRRRRERSRQCRLAYRGPAAPGPSWRGGCLRPRRPSAVGDALSARPRDQGSSAARKRCCTRLRWPSTSARISSSCRFRARSQQ